MNVLCPYCKKDAQLVDSSEIYSSGTSYGLAWLCRDCQAWVGCHKGSKDNKPLGRLANAELRAARRKAHLYFDRLWEAKMNKEGCSKSFARQAGYAWLADSLGLPPGKCHIAWMDVEQCEGVVKVCSRFLKKAAISQRF